MGREYGAYFTYKFKRGDVCNNCGTIFGYDVEERVSESSRQGPKEAEQKAIKEGERVGREEASEPCPNCGRIPSEAYASLLGSWKIFLVLLGVPAVCAYLACVLIIGFTGVVCWVACCVAAQLAELLGLDRLVSEIESLFSYFGALMESDAPGLFIIFGAALIYAAVTCLFIARHIRLFRSPAANLRAMEKAKAREAKAERKAERKAETSAERKAKRKAETSAERKVEMLGYSSKSKIDPNLKGRRTFWALSATQILFMSAGFCFYAALAAYECEASWAERFFNALANFYAAIGADKFELRNEDGLDMFGIWFTTSLAAYLLALVTWPLYAWVGRDAVRFQGTRHFACGWKFEGTNIGGKSKDMRKLELDASRRTVKTLRAADCLTEAGREMLAIAEKECGETQRDPRQETVLKNGKKRIKYGGRRGRK